MNEIKTYQEVMTEKRQSEHKTRIANNKAIIQAMTDDELFTTRDMINKELKFRQTDFLTIPNYNGGIR